MTGVKDSSISNLLYNTTSFSWLWLILRVYVGWEWVDAGWNKLFNPAWTGAKAGVAVQGFLTKALEKASGPHPDVQDWYAAFVQNIALPNSVVFSYLVTYGEIAVGIGLILGALTGVAAFFGALMNMNYLLAGTVSINPVLLIGQIFIMLAWKVAGWYGLDRFILPFWDVFNKSEKSSKKG